ncbi:MAG: Fe-S cluster assembly protein SufD [Thiotrichales bacterium]|nr:Fe-S cluster assembly protein SufD [Thiotrichales bacterium]
MVKKRSPIAQQALDFYLQQAQQIAQTSQNPFLSKVRQQAQERFVEQAFPTAKDEDWKYSKLSGFLAQHFSQQGISQPVANWQAWMPSFPVIKLVWVDGHFCETLSDELSQLPAGVLLESFADALQANTELGGLFANQDTVLAEPFASLNSMLFQDGMVLEVAANVTLSLPIFVLHLQTQPLHHSVLRQRVSVGENAEVTLIERYVSLQSQGAGCVNVVTEIELGKHARVQQILLQEQNRDSFYFNNQFIYQAEASQFTTFYGAIGSQLSRHQNHLFMDGEQIENQQNSACIGLGAQTVDSRTCTHHNQAKGFSRQLHKFVLEDQAIGVFDGMIRVDQQAQKTDGQMDNKNLLLSDFAKMNTKPKLEIYADDVKCSHGSASGQIDKNQIFYLQARGIHKADALRMITQAFLLEPAEVVRQEPIRRWVMERLALALQQTHLP